MSIERLDESKYFMSIQDIADEIGVCRKTVQNDIESALSVMYGILKLNNISYEDLI